MTVERRALSPAEVANATGLDVRSVYRLMESGELEYLQVLPRKRLVSMRMLDAFLAGERAA